MNAQGDTFGSVTTVTMEKSRRHGAHLTLYCVRNALASVNAKLTAKKGAKNSQKSISSLDKRGYCQISILINFKSFSNILVASVLQYFSRDFNASRSVWRNSILNNTFAVRTCVVFSSTHLVEINRNLSGTCFIKSL